MSATTKPNDNFTKSQRKLSKCRIIRIAVNWKDRYRLGIIWCKGSLRQRADPASTIARHTDSQPRVMVRGAISFEAGPLSLSLEAHLHPKRCVNDILRTVLLLFLLQFLGLIFQPDNTKLHIIRVAMNCLTTYQTLLWPSRSPDLSSAQHVWDMMGRRLHLPWNVDYLAQ
ncbi:uncharacterized protein TNCV_3249321 [Trichonephila clavipes]|nr:uncharacterized protein TNCV_3249321 [Trichonephila clavipes]